MPAKLYIGKAFKLVFQTMPVLWARMITGGLVALALIAYAVVGIGLMVGSAALWEPLLIFVGIAVAIGFGLLVRYLSINHLYMMKAAHAAVLTHRILNDEKPDGLQVSFGKQQVNDRFGSAQKMYRVDRRLSRTVGRFNSRFIRGLNRLPVPGGQFLTRMARRLTRMMTQHIDQAILSRAYIQTEDDPWTVARDGMVLYAQAWKPVLANAVTLSLLSAVEFIVLLVILAIPVLAVAAVASLTVTIIFAIAAFIIAYMIKVSVSDAFSLAATLLAYHRSTADLEPDPEWSQRLSQAIDPFGELARKASTSLQTTLGEEDTSEVQTSGDFNVRGPK